MYMHEMDRYTEVYEADTGHYYKVEWYQRGPEWVTVATLGRIDSTGAYRTPIYEGHYDHRLNGKPIYSTGFIGWPPVDEEPEPPEASRLTRSLSHLCAIIAEIKKRHVKLICGALVVDCTAPKLDAMTVAMLQIMGVFAELERELTIERIHSGLAHAKRKGVKLGRPKKTASEVPEAVRALWPRYVAGEFTKAEYARLAGISRTAVYKYIGLLTSAVR